MGRPAVELTGVQAALDAFDALGAAAEAELRTALSDEGDAVVADAQREVRVDEGELQQSISAETAGMSTVVKPRDVDVLKAIVNEFGRESDPGKPYMAPAAEVSRVRWPRRAAEAVRRAADAQR